MSALAGPFFAAAALLGVGGALKARRPAPTASALAAVGLPVSPLLVRLGGAAEVFVAAGALAWGNRLSAVLVAGSYLVFAGFVALALARDVPISSCGCFGAQETPPSLVHLLVNLAAALVAVVVAVRPVGGLGDLGELAARGGSAPSLLLQTVFLAGVAACAYLAYAALTLLPRVRRASGVGGGSGDGGVETTRLGSPGGRA